MPENFADRPTVHRFGWINAVAFAIRSGTDFSSFATPV
jgi:hypothetical protein